MAATLPSILGVRSLSSRRLPTSEARLSANSSRLMLFFLYWQKHPDLFQPWDQGTLVFGIGQLSRRLGVSTGRLRDYVQSLETLGTIRVVEATQKRMCIAVEWPTPPSGDPI